MAAPGFAGVQPYSKNPLSGPLPGSNPALFRAGPGGAGAASGGGGGRTNRFAVEGAKAYRDALGLPSWEDILTKFGGGQGTTEYGNAGAAGAGADFAKGEVENWKTELAGQRGNLAKQRGNVNIARGAIAHPTRSSGFKDVMRLTNERVGNAVENDRRLAAEAAQKRGFVGGYNPERSDRDRLETIATAGYEAANQARAAAQDQFKSEVGLLGAEGDIYRTGLEGYGTSLGAYTDLTKTMAELPTKYLTAYSSLLGGLGGGFGDIFRTSSNNVQFDTGNDREDAARLRQERKDMRDRLRNTPGAAGFV